MGIAFNLPGLGGFGSLDRERYLTPTEGTVTAGNAFPAVRDDAGWCGRARKSLDARTRWSEAIESGVKLGRDSVHLVWAVRPAEAA